MQSTEWTSHETLRKTLTKVVDVDVHYGSYKNNKGAETPTRDMPRGKEKLSKVLRDLIEQVVFDVHLCLFKIVSQLTRDAIVKPTIINHL